MDIERLENENNKAYEELDQLVKDFNNQYKAIVDRLHENINPVTFNNSLKLSKLDESCLSPYNCPLSYDRKRLTVKTKSNDPIYLMAYQDEEEIDIDGKSDNEIIELFKEWNTRKLERIHHTNDIAFVYKNVCLVFLFPKTKEIKYISLDVEKYSMVIV